MHGLMVTVFAYGLWHLAWYWQTPLGQSPVLDERENLDLAAQIARGTLPPEPFYRAMLYPLILAVPFALGVPETLIPHMATLVGVLLHLMGTLFVHSIARRWFARSEAGLIAAVLYGFNPVLVHYATQILDATLGNVLFLGGLWSFTRAAPTDRPGRWWLAGALAWALAGLARPQLLVLFVALVPVAWLLRRTHMARGDALKLAGAAGAAVILLLLQGFVQLSLSGSFRILPTQGPYNLWAANKPGANGRYFTQSIYLPTAGRQENPARIESLVLYQHETGATTADLEAANRHWTRRFREALVTQPLAVAAVQLRKSYYLLNHQEQYNNKTYSFHKARSPALSWNILGWGWVWALGLAGVAAILLRRRHALASAVAILFVFVAAGILTGYASGRFRLPLVALFACTAGGVVGLPELLRHMSRRHVASVGALWFVLVVFAFTRFGDVADRSTYLQDHLLLAAAAERTGDDLTTWNETGAALTLVPDRPDALAMRVTSYFNLLVQGQAPVEQEREWWSAAESYVRLPSTVRVRSVEVVAALAQWRQGRDAQAIELLRTLTEQPSTNRNDALAALAIIGAAALDQQVIEAANAGGSSPLVLLAAATEAEDTENSATATIRAALERVRARP